MNYKLLMSILLLSIGLSNSSCALEVDNMKASRCGMLDDFFRIAFVSNEKNKSWLFSLSSDSSTVKISHRRNRAVIDWKYIEALHLTSSGNFVVEFYENMSFVSGDSFRELDFGKMDMDCWGQLKDYVGDGIPFKQG